MYRLKVLKTFLRAAVPLSKLDAFRDLLEENMFRLTDRRHMSDLVPFIHTQEQAVIKAEISGKPVSVVFDGNSRLGEAMAVVVRYVDDSFAIQQPTYSPSVARKKHDRRRDCAGPDQYPFSPVQYKL